MLTVMKKKKIIIVIIITVISIIIIIKVIAVKINKEKSKKSGDKILYDIFL